MADYVKIYEISPTGQTSRVGVFAAERGGQPAHLLVLEFSAVYSIGDMTF